MHLSWRSAPGQASLAGWLQPPSNSQRDNATPWHHRSYVFARPGLWWRGAWRGHRMNGKVLQYFQWHLYLARHGSPPPSPLPSPSPTRWHLKIYAIKFVLHVCEYFSDSWPGDFPHFARDNFDEGQVKRESEPSQRKVFKFLNYAGENGNRNVKWTGTGAGGAGWRTWVADWSFGWPAK